MWVTKALKEPRKPHLVMGEKYRKQEIVYEPREPQNGKPRELPSSKPRELQSSEPREQLMSSTNSQEINMVNQQSPRKKC
eukprot:3531038-Ditylum_brightwellii.AAC.1